VVVDTRDTGHQIAEISSTLRDDLLNEDQKQVFIAAIIKGQTANPIKEQGNERDS
jgi:hypothetical protein